MSLSVYSVTIDCANPARLAEFWNAALGYQTQSAESEYAEISDPNGKGPRLVFVKVPEAKALKNRTHLDLETEDRQAEVQRLVGLGASVEHDVRRATTIAWTVMTDPEGNEFCVLPPNTDPV